MMTKPTRFTPTPHPWYVEDDEFLIRGEAGTNVARILTPDDVADESDLDEARSNRALILIAPDLLNFARIVANSEIAPLGLRIRAKHWLAQAGVP